LIHGFEKIEVLGKAAAAIFLKKKHPLIAVWHVTYRCNLRCRYCGYWERGEKELDAAEALELVREFRDAGVRFVVLTGGEPLMRRDIGEIISACKKNGMYVSINSNGTMVRERISEIKGADAIKLSLDGSRDVNDRIKGDGVYDEIIAAIDLCKRSDIKVSITTVISCQNSDRLSEILGVAREHDVKVWFQPASQTHCGNIDKEISSEVPSGMEYRKAIDFLIRCKKKKEISIGNSLSGLKHLAAWPVKKRVPCLTGKLSFFVSPNKKIFLCDMFPGSQRYLTSVEGSIKNSFKKLSFPSTCGECWVGSVVDFNLLANLTPDCLWSACRDFVSRR